MPAGFLYQRVSTTEQDTARQHAANRAFAAELGLTIEEFNDDGIGASSRSHGKLAGANRPGYGDMMARILAASPGDTLVAHDVSRADRQLETWSALLSACRRRGVLVGVTEEREVYDPRKTNHWRTLATAGVAAEADSLGKGDQIKSGIAYWRTQGHPHGRPTYGIKRVNDPDKIRNRWQRDIPDPCTAPVAARIVREVAAGKPYAQIARDLNSEGIPVPRDGARWRSSSLAKIARGARAYAALGIVTDRQASDCLSVLQRTSGMGRGSGTKAQTHRYSGTIACHACGAPLRGSIRAGEVARYRCPAGHVAVKASDVDTYLDAWAIARLARPDAITLLASDGQAAEDARQRAADLQADLDAWVTTPGITARAYALKAAELQPLITQALADAQRVSVPGALAGLPDGDQSVVASRWEALTIGARKAAIRTLAPVAAMGPGTRDGKTPVSDRITMA